MQDLRWNGVRHQPGRARPHVESFFLKLNDPTGRRALWLKATILERAPQHGNGGAVAEAWAIAFDRDGRHVAAKQTVPLGDARFSRSRLDLHVGQLDFAEGRAHGLVGAASLASIGFDLRFETSGPPLVPFPSRRMYEGSFPSSKLVSPHPDVAFTGRYTVNGETVNVGSWRGMQGHNWGARHAELYAWCHCNAWDGADDLVLEGMTARVKLGPFLAPPLTLVCVRHRGVRYDFNDVVALARARGEIGPRRWRFDAQSSLARVSGEMWADTDDFVGLAYENPDGATTYCLNSKIARGRLRLAVRGRAPVDVVTRAAALELGTKDPRHGVAMVA